MSVGADQGTASSGRAPGGVTALLLRHPYRPLLASFVGLHLATNSTLIGLLGSDALRWALGLDAAVLLLTVILGFARGVIWPSVVALLTVGFLALQLVVFAALSHLPVNWNVLYSYLPLAALPLFAQARDDVDWLANAAFFMSLGYCVLYVLVSLELGSLLLSGRAGDLHVLDADDRGPRLAISMGYVAYCLCFGVAGFRQQRRAIFGLAIGVGLAAIAVSHYRAFTATVALVLAIYLVVGLGRARRQVLALGFVLAVLVMLAGMLMPGWSVYGLFAADPSIAARQRGYAVLAPYLAAHPFLGLGLPSNGTDLWRLLGEPYVFWEDLGPVGVWASFGLVGLAAYLGLALFAILGPRRPDMSPIAYRAVTLSAVVCGLSAAYSPDIFGGSSVTVVGLLVAAAASRKAAEAGAASRPEL